MGKISDSRGVRFISPALGAGARRFESCLSDDIFRVAIHVVRLPRLERGLLKVQLLPIRLKYGCDVTVAYRSPKPFVGVRISPSVHVNVFCICRIILFLYGEMVSRQTVNLFFLVRIRVGEQKSLTLI